MSLDIYSLDSVTDWDYGESVQQMTSAELTQFEMQAQYLSGKMKSERVEAIASIVAALVLFALGMLACLATTDLWLPGLVMIVLSGLSIYLSSIRISDLRQQEALCANAISSVKQQMDRLYTLQIDEDTVCIA